MATPVFVDTGAHYALATSNFIISEVSTLLRQRLGWEAAVHDVEGLRAGSTQVISVSAADEVRAWEIVRRDDDQDLSYVDATSFAVMERLGIHVFFAFDAHFSTFRTQRGQAFTNIKFLV